MVFLHCLLFRRPWCVGLLGRWFWDVTPWTTSLPAGVPGSSHKHRLCQVQKQSYPLPKVRPSGKIFQLNQGIWNIIVKAPFNFRCLEEHPCKDCQYWPIYPCYSSKRPMVACIHEYTNDPISTFREDPDKYRLVLYLPLFTMNQSKIDHSIMRHHWFVTFSSFFQLCNLYVWPGYHRRPRCKAIQVLRADK